MRAKNLAAAAPLSCNAPDLGVLINAVEAEVIPRLLLARSRRRQAALRPTMTDIERICGFALDRDVTGATEYVAGLAAAGIPLDAIYLQLLGPSARLLGDMWEQDRVSFVDVTVGLCTLHQILFRLAVEDDASGAMAEAPGSALFAPVPGETHVFGTLIVAKMFARAGWNCWTELGESREALIALQEDNGFELVGLSMSCDRHAESLRATVAALRGAACPPRTIFVGGPAFHRAPGLASEVGADALANDPSQAIRLAEQTLYEASSDA